MLKCRLGGHALVDGTGLCMFDWVVPFLGIKYSIEKFKGYIPTEYILHTYSLFGS